MIVDSDSSSSVPEPSCEPAGDEISFWEVLAALVRGRRLIVGLAVLGGLIAVLVTFLSPPAYVVEASFRPQAGEDGLGQLSSVAAQFGFRVPGQAQAESPELYAELIRSRAVLKPLAEREFPGVLEEPVSLDRLLEMDGEDRDIRTAQVVEWLREEAVTSSVGRQTGIVNVTVETRWPLLSAELAEGVLDEVNRFNAETRRSQATAERRFVEERLEAARAELLGAEGELKAFLQANRSWQGSPELRFEHDRLQREVLRREQVFTSLSEAFEQARIAEVRNTPVITVLEEPYIPPRPEARRVGLSLLLGLGIGACFAAVVTLIRHTARPDRPEDRQAFEEVRTWWGNSFPGWSQERM